eukprot:m.100993 g.100993  ORF g.100993 m.100993 type:complete len:363 (+) comp13732_c0_seq2:107-1195(+)
MEELGILAVSSGISAITFPLVLASIQQFVFLPVRICAHNLLAPVAGLVAVSLAGMCASSTFLMIAHCNFQNLGDSFRKGNGFSKLFKNLQSALTDKLQSLQAKAVESRQVEDLSIFVWDSAKVLLDRNTAISVLTTLLVFKTLGGEFNRVCPSHVFFAGAFAFKSIPATRFKYATEQQKYVVDRIGNEGYYCQVSLYSITSGRKFGCHTCGGPQIHPLRFIADHQPPSKYAQTTNVIFLPQCSKCSNLQGGVANTAATIWEGGIKAIVTHSFRLRLYHLWLPIGSVFILYSERHAMKGNANMYPKYESEDLGFSEKDTWDGKVRKRTKVNLGSLVSKHQELEYAKAQRYNYIIKKVSGNHNK